MTLMTFFPASILPLKKTFLRITHSEGKCQILRFFFLIAWYSSVSYVALLNMSGGQNLHLQCYITDTPTPVFLLI